MSGNDEYLKVFRLFLTFKLFLQTTNSYKVECNVPDDILQFTFKLYRPPNTF